MPVKTKLEDGTGSKRAAKVSLNNSLYISEVAPDLPASGTRNQYRFYNELLGSTGAGAGVTNQNVNGAITPQTFFIEGHDNYDIHIMGIIIIIADTATVHNNFGNVAALGTGWDLEAVESGERTFIIEKAQTGGQVIAQSGFFNPYGNTATSWELTNWTGLWDAQTIYIPISTWIPSGLRLGRGTHDRLVSTVNDNLTGLTEFWQRAVGYRHYNPGD